MMDGIERAAVLGRSREFIDRMLEQGLLVESECVNGHKGMIPSEYGWFTFSTLLDWFHGTLATGVRWPVEIRFANGCEDCASLDLSSPGEPLPNA